uniref:Nucleoid-structuring protein H-NS n=1 Tax=Pseudomonas graminis TaxID=158627 RepID=A0A7C2BA95_9PSED
MPAPGWAPRSSGSLHSGPAPWARRHPPSMAGGGSRGIHAARPTERDLRSACTEVAIGGD